VFGFASAEAALEAALEARDTSIVAEPLPDPDRASALRALGESEPPDAALAVTIGSVPEAVRAQGARLADIVRPVGQRGDRGVRTPMRSGGRVADLTWRRGSGATLSLRIRTPPRATRVKALRGGGGAPARGATVRATIDVATGVLHARRRAHRGRQAVGIVTRVREALGLSAGPA
jgi:hypothetical protein